jgi:4-amino-4-deoxy-L-arabinose transferase-like glycosyltransferase
MNPDRLKLLLTVVGIGGIVSGFATYFLSYRDHRQRKLAFVGLGLIVLCAAMLSWMWLFNMF